MFINHIKWARIIILTGKIHFRKPKSNFFPRSYCTKSLNCILAQG